MDVADEDLVCKMNLNLETVYQVYVVLVEVKQ